MKSNIHSRRSFGLIGAGAIASGSAVFGQETESAPREVRRLNSAMLLDVSPNGAFLCTYSAKILRESFTVRDGAITHIGTGDQDNRGVVSILRTRDWKTLATYAPPATVEAASFFADSNSIFFDADSFGPNKLRRRVVIRDEWRHVSEVDHLFSVNSANVLSALWGDSLLAVQARLSGLLAAPPRNPEFEIRVLPDYHRVRNAPIVLSTPGAEIRAGLHGLANDRKRFVSATTKSIVCWNLESLKLLWEVAMPQNVTPYSVAISGDGRIAAAGASEGLYFGKVDRYFVGIYRGDDGKEIGKHPVRGYESLALSSDGKHFVAGRRVSVAGTQDLSIEFEVYETEAGKSVGRLTHLKVPPGRFQFMLTEPNRAAFLNDKHLVVSGGEQVSVWQL